MVAKSGGESDACKRRPALPLYILCDINRIVDSGMRMGSVVVFEPVSLEIWNCVPAVTLLPEVALGPALEESKGSLTFLTLEQLEASLLVQRT